MHLYDQTEINYMDEVSHADKHKYLYRVNVCVCVYVVLKLEKIIKGCDDALILLST